MTMAHPEAMEELLSLVWERLLSEEKLLFNLFALTVRARLARALVELADESTDGIVRTPQDDLATLVGTTRQEVTRILG